MKMKQKKDTKKYTIKFTLKQHCQSGRDFFWDKMTLAEIIEQASDTDCCGGNQGYDDYILSDLQNKEALAFVEKNGEEYWNTDPDGWNELIDELIECDIDTFISYLAYLMDDKHFVELV